MGWLADIDWTATGSVIGTVGGIGGAAAGVVSALAANRAASYARTQAEAAVTQNELTRQAMQRAEQAESTARTRVATAAAARVAEVYDLFDLAAATLAEVGRTLSPSNIYSRRDAAAALIRTAEATLQGVATNPDNTPLSVLADVNMGITLLAGIRDRIQNWQQVPIGLRSNRDDPLDLLSATEAQIKYVANAGRKKHGISSR